MLKSETGIPGVAGGGRVQALVEFGAEDSPINRTDFYIIQAEQSSEESGGAAFGMKMCTI